MINNGERITSGAGTLYLAESTDENEHVGDISRTRILGHCGQVRCPARCNLTSVRAEALQKEHAAGSQEQDGPP